MTRPRPDSAAEPDLRTRYLGLDLEHPIVASASPLTADLDGILRLADAGVAAIVMASIYEEQVVAEELAQAALLEQGSDTQPEATGYFPQVPADRGVLEGRLQTLRLASQRAGVPIIASLNAKSNTGWVDVARRLEEAGASAIELNIYRVPADPAETGAAVEDSYAEILRVVKDAVNVPVAVKLVPFFSSPANMATKLVQAGADGLVLFNRFYEPDIDLDSLKPRTDFQLSTPYDIRLPLMWIGLLSRHVNASFAASTGVWSGDEVVKYLLAGADVTMTTSALLQHGPQHVTTLLDGLRDWMHSRGFESVAALKGRLAADQHPAAAAQFLRAQYHEILTTGYLGIGC
ncbi:dihydroorotate dehydrogenase-like protein [Mycobacterium malmoense]|uniref:Diguanylate cyclase n=1 Tax=Mycobacterium malmoense TaxID=1780 RepID=A0ABX3ST31_MYCMA|nr:dihydroorotate dehydrogenase-like protein [Mycobacterium malmoense]OIN78921.1 diguanylate cyclase [Mycobacterium malmoense]ORA83673.1 diguanylate cyclase [Mycobacterium malmoense]QZA18788.1 dihydroorotate dehydrogenase-like protein [Mycobacterium malmoense]UNB95558.1 dihydroorotate dehydrogenase-like protein [Mycobacterium malmoense]